ncbi:hypothetical protein [Nostoc sp.]|uniref:hypothetical protein n=1 Tax=Nostoc sp. TaxID=1180 RepID=UPI002FF8486D
MPRVTELLNQIVELVQQYNSEEWHKVNLDPGLTPKQIQSYLEGKSFTLPIEIIELYQWRNGTGYGSLFPSAESGYDEQEFYSLASALELGEEWEQDFTPIVHVLPLFGFEGTYYWTVLPETQQELATLYVTDEADFDTSSPNYPSLTAMLEKQIRRLKFVWKID